LRFSIICHLVARRLNIAIVVGAVAFSLVSLPPNADPITSPLNTTTTNNNNKTMAPRAPFSVSIQPQMAMYTVILGTVCGLSK
jgi:hypothetical protein